MAEKFDPMDGPNPYQSPGCDPSPNGDKGPSFPQAEPSVSKEMDRICNASMIVWILSSGLGFVAIAKFLDVGWYADSQMAVLLLALVVFLALVGSLLGILSWCNGTRPAKIFVGLNLAVVIFAAIPLFFVATTLGLSIFG